MKNMRLHRTIDGYFIQNTCFVWQHLIIQSYREIEISNILITFSVTNMTLMTFIIVYKFIL